MIDAGEGLRGKVIALSSHVDLRDFFSKETSNQIIFISDRDIIPGMFYCFHKARYFQRNIFSELSSNYINRTNRL